MAFSSGYGIWDVWVKAILMSEFKLEVWVLIFKTKHVNVSEKDLFPYVTFSSLIVKEILGCQSKLEHFICRNHMTPSNNTNQRGSPGS
jgi:hypothetical protein